MKSSDIRRAFLAYFKSKQHQIVASSSLIPKNDASLLFTNAGMVQFKDTFLGVESRPYTRATSSQRCVRAGGKHNDLDNVGYTARHHTFFEMLGNFSFGDYFKREAIQFAWEFLTQHLKLPEEKLWVTVFREDDEAADIWLNEMKVSPTRFSRCDEEENFWSMGDTGPCGPCSEIFYDHGEDIPGGPPGSETADLDRYIEIWNLVFMQYNRSADGHLTLLPKPSVDTGMGLERISAVMQGVHNNYDIDLFQALISAAAKLTQTHDHSKTSLRVLADHIRSSAFLIIDGVIPNNEGRGYVLRRIVRRACRHGHQLGMNHPFFYQLVPALVKQMGDAYPELVKMQDMVMQVLHQEELQFSKTLEQGMHILQAALETLSGDVIPGALAFKLYDTYGFPLDLTEDIAREHHLTVDIDGFNNAMAEQRGKSKGAAKFSYDTVSKIATEEETTFCGYEDLQIPAASIQGLYLEGNSVTQFNVGDEGVVLLNDTPFYAEAGGQVGDCGQLIQSDGSVFQIHDTQKQNKTILHYGRVIKGVFKTGQTVCAVVDASSRRAIACNHSATHLLHAALRKILGEHVQQKGSLVDATHLRFDFTHHQALKDEVLTQIERLVNQHIRLNHVVVTDIMAYEEAKDSGAMALFGEKYEDKVRVLRMGDFSKELCGGTHVLRTGDIGLFKITAQSSVAAGIRRIDAVTAEVAMDYIEKHQAVLQQVTDLFKTTTAALSDKALQILEENKSYHKEIQHLKAQMSKQQGSQLLEQAIDVQGVKVLAVNLGDADVTTLRHTMDMLKQKLKKAVMVLASVHQDKVHLVSGVSKGLTQQLHAGELIKHIAATVGGKGGGRPDMAQAGGNNPAALAGALAQVEKWVEEKLNQ